MSTLIATFAFKRSKHLSQTLKALAHNIGAKEIELVIYCDGPRHKDEVEAVEQTRAVARNCDGFKLINVICREQNYGLAKSIITGVTEQLEQHEQIIVLEDDMITSPYFLQYMHEALELYRDNEQVISIHGYTYPIKESLPETFFLRGADCWGWATWRRGWKLFNPDGRYLLHELKRKHLLTQFDMDGAAEYSQMLQDQIQEKNDSWAVRWHASAFLANRLTLYPGTSLVHNIGNDATGTHCGTTDRYDVLVSQRPIQVQSIPIEPSEIAFNAFKAYFSQPKVYPASRLSRLRKMLSFSVLFQR
jgi:hypothetical protein